MQRLSGVPVDRVDPLADESIALRQRLLVGGQVVVRAVHDDSWLKLLAQHLVRSQKPDVGDLCGQDGVSVGED